MIQANAIGCLTATFAVCFATLAMAADKPAPEKKMSPSKTAVRQVVQQHIDGIVKADAKLLEEAWDAQSGQITFVSQDKQGKEIVQTGPITESFKLWTDRKLPGTKGTIQSVDIVHDKMALVKAQITWKRQVFDDYLVLLNTDGQWKLVSKTYTSKRASFGYYGAF